MTEPCGAFREMIRFTEQSSEATWKGYLYAVTMFLVSVMQSLSQHICLFYTTSMALRISASITSTVYRKVACVPQLHYHPLTD